MGRFVNQAVRQAGRPVLPATTTRPQCRVSAAPRSQPGQPCAFWPPRSWAGSKPPPSSPPCCCYRSCHCPAPPWEPPTRSARAWPGCKAKSLARANPAAPRRWWRPPHPVAKAAKPRLRWRASSPAVVTLISTLPSDASTSTQALVCQSHLHRLLGSIANAGLAERSVAGGGYSAYPGQTGTDGGASLLDTGWALHSQWQSLTPAELTDTIAWLRTRQ